MTDQSPDVNFHAPPMGSADETPRPSGLVINEVQLLLAEKRTSLAVLRTGIAVLVLPLSVLSILVTTSKFYMAAEVLHFLIPLLIVCVLLMIFGGYMMIRALVKIHRFDKLIHEIKSRDSALSRYIDAA